MSNFRRNVAQIASGTVMSQVVILLMTPVLTRVLGPASFGGLALFSSVYAVLSGVLTMKYEQSILLPTDDATASALTTLTMHLSASLSVFVMAGMALASVAGRLPVYWLCLPLCTLLAAVYASIQQWGARLRDYSAYSSSLVLGSVVNSGLSLAFALVFGDSPADLIAGFSCGLVASVGFALARQHTGFDNVCGPGRVHWRRLAALARQYREFPLHVLPTSLAVGAASYGPPLVLGATFSLSTTGYYAIASKFVLLPSVLLGAAISEAFRAEFMARMREQKELAGFSRSLLLKISLAAIPACVMMALLAPWVFGLIFGSKYEYSGILVRYVMLGALGMLIVQPFQCVFVGLRRSGVGLVMQSILSVVPLLLLYFVARVRPLEQALLWHSVSVLLLSLATAVLALRLTAHSDRQVSFAHA
jgi:O-antigen/teichoic acid export membrane protein